MGINPTILEANGKPAFVVLPYDEYLKLTEGKKPAGRIPADGTTPTKSCAYASRTAGA
ncbi:hypothetical protein [Neopusillimonas aromaticivorans]|uniref:hypothetical protein n=1 Tax=Neopusillimonas aromaticivorans TaxID=2979868 RepID=UPI003314D6B2